MTSRAAFLDAINEATLAFPRNVAARKILSGEFTRKDYHALLVLLFHQTFEAPSFTALAASNIGAGREAARDFLLSAAAEGRDHWRWILDDLAATEYAGPDPREVFAHPASQAYIAYNYFMGLKAPFARLAIMAMIEAVSSSFSENFSNKLFQTLDLRPAQARFFYRRPEGQRAEQVHEVIGGLDLSEREWAWMSNAATTSGNLYRALFDVL